MGRGESLGRQLRRARMARGMTQAEAARAIEAQQSAISMFERGESSALGLDRLRKLAELLGVSLAPDALGQAPAEQLVGFCEEADCPSHGRRIVGARLVIVPGFQRVAGEGPSFCGTCLAPMHRSCPHCTGTLSEGLLCRSCSHPYLEPLEFHDARMARRHLLRSLASTDPELARSHPEYLLFEDEPLDLEEEEEEPAKEEEKGSVPGPASSPRAKSEASRMRGGEA